MTPPCRQCFAGIHSKCEGDFTAHCGCRACYNDSDERFRRGPFWTPPDGTHAVAPRAAMVTAHQGAWTADVWTCSSACPHPDHGNVRAIPAPIPDVTGAALALAEVVETYWEILLERNWHPSQGSAVRARDYIQYHLDRYRDACSAAAAIERPDR